MSSIKLVLFCFSAAISLPAVAAPKSAQEAVIAQVTRETRHDFYRPTARRIARAVRRVDIDGDGVADWQANFGIFDSPAWCGTGGCRLMLWRGRPNGRIAKVFDDQVLLFRWGTKQGRPTLFTNQHGSLCGGVGADACPTNYQWNRRNGRFIPLPRPQRFHYHL